MVLLGDAELGEILSKLECCELFAGLRARRLGSAVPVDKTPS